MNYDTTLRDISSNLLLFPPSYVRKLPSGSCSGITSFCIISLNQGRKIHFHVKQQSNM